jgi:hypothetical protein
LQVLSQGGVGETPPDTAASASFKSLAAYFAADLGGFATLAAGFLATFATLATTSEGLPTCAVFARLEGIVDLVFLVAVMALQTTVAEPEVTGQAERPTNIWFASVSALTKRLISLRSKQE